MCGIAGFIGIQGARRSLAEQCAAMSKAIHHRGPDSSGFWLDEALGLGLVHTRLSIVELSELGAQPMVSSCLNFVLVFNGEIYNHLDIRSEIRKKGFDVKWRGHSDTETLLEAISLCGIDWALEQSIGMFAFAVWNKATAELILARDRVGEKPLYAGWLGQANEAKVFGFASELKALKAHSAFNNPVNREALGMYLRYLYVPTPLSIFEDIAKLEPGTYWVVKGEKIEKHVYWSLRETVQKRDTNQHQDENLATLELEGLLSDAVNKQQMSDVPIGAFLSGGIDSSTVVALMQKSATSKVKTYTIGFEDKAFNEAPFAKKVAEHLGTDHHELYVSSQDAMNVIGLLPKMYDEPFADSSQIPTFLVSQAAKRDVTVALSGDAGDELLGGYNRYVWGNRVWSKISWLPFELRKLLGHAVETLPTHAWDALAQGRIARLGDKAHKMAQRLKSVQSHEDLYHSLVSEWDQPERIVKNWQASSSLHPLTSLEGGGKKAWVPDEREFMMLMDMHSYLPDDILCKVDRAAMAVSLETRIPFLDHRVVEFAWNLPMHLKIRQGQGKWILRQILYKYVPKELIERPKAGFGIPLGSWLRGPLKEWAQSLIEPKRIEAEGYFYSAPIAKIWQEHLSGQRDWSGRLWTVLMFQAWLADQ